MIIVRILIRKRWFLTFKSFTKKRSITRKKIPDIVKTALEFSSWIWSLHCKDYVVWCEYELQWNFPHYGIFTLHETGAVHGTGLAQQEILSPPSCPCLGSVWTFLYHVLEPIDAGPGPCSIPGPAPVQCGYRSTISNAADFCFQKLWLELHSLMLW